MRHRLADAVLHRRRHSGEPLGPGLGGRWAVWRRRLQAEGIPVAPICVGAVEDEGVWRPWAGGAERPAPARAVRRTLGTAIVLSRTEGAALHVLGDFLGDAPPAAARAAATALAAHGLLLTAVLYDGEGRVVAVDALPPIPSDLAEQATRRVTEALSVHLHRR